MKIREFEPGDGDAVSSLIRETMKTSNAKDYSAGVLEPLIEYFSPAKVLQLNRERRCFVAESDGQIVGTAAIENSELCTFFVHHDFQRKGIGTRLLKAIEKNALTAGIRRIKVESSITAAAFYEKAGYRKTGFVKEATAGKQIEMEKSLGE